METIFWSETAFLPLLSTLTFVPLLAMVCVWYAQTAAIALRFAFAAAITNVVLSVYLLMVFDVGNPNIQLAEQLKFFGLSYSVGVDGANILFVPLTAVLTLLALIYTLITRHVTDKLFIACLLAYETILIGAFVALNVLQFWLWTALELLPVILLTINAGTGQQRRSIIGSFLYYWLGALVMTLAGFLIMGFGMVDAEHSLTFDWLTLKQHNGHIRQQVLIFLLLFYGFAIRMPLFPFHGWLPVLAEHGTVASVAIFLVGLKLGIYALVRFILPLVPNAAEQWENFVLSLGIISIFYGALLALMQINIRRLLAFAVISQTGMLVIGVFCFNEYGMEGSLLLSIAYGLATAGMLFSVGLIYERTRTSFIPRLGGLFDSNASIALLFLICALSTMAMPGTPGFDAAHVLIEGVIEEEGWLIAIGILLGNVLAAAFLLRAFLQMFIATPKRGRQLHSSIEDPILKERIITLVICGLLIGTGFYSTPWLNFIDQEATMIGKYYQDHAIHHNNQKILPTK